MRLFRPPACHTAVFTEALMHVFSLSSFCENILCEGEDEEEEDGRLGSTIEGSESTKPSSGLPGSLAGSDCSSSSDSNSSVLNGLAPQGTTGLSRLAAVATAASLGIDISELTSAQKSVKSVSSSSSATSPYAGSHLGEYVRRYRYPDGDTRYDWLSCPLTEMQHRPRAHLATALLPSKDGASGPNLVYDSSLPAASTLTQPRRRPFLLTGMASSSGGLSRKMLRCEECGKYYRNEYSLHHHICLKRKDVWKKGDVPSGLIDGQVIYFCPACNKPFKWLGNLTRHYYVHTGQRFFKCDICQKEFFSAYQVKRHMNSHTGLRFNCEVCDKPFTCKYACAWHMRQHSNSSSLVELVFCIFVLFFLTFLPDFLRCAGFRSSRPSQPCTYMHSHRTVYCLSTLPLSGLELFKNCVLALEGSRLSAFCTCFSADGLALCTHSRMVLGQRWSKTSSIRSSSTRTAPTFTTVAEDRQTGQMHGTRGSLWHRRGSVRIEKTQRAASIPETMSSLLCPFSSILATRYLNLSSSSRKSLLPRGAFS
ncbi:unnamed protein product [Schistocephalus solidus]|uniref:Zinc finger protein n=1 Tax=Schistocephalus solidus TaxID=70667 RepID=A0A183SM03_SCHSO|nr:unnamed protein product [Schistocephalus solidus]